jgi:hypothetical protein
MDRELLLIHLYCMVDETSAQPALAAQLVRGGRRPKLPDVALLTLALFQEFSGICDEDEYWKYVWREHGSCFPGQRIDRSQYNRRKKNLAALTNQIRQLVARLLPNSSNLHIIDCVGTTAITLTKFFGSYSFPNAGIGRCAAKDTKYAGYKTATIVSPAGIIEDFMTGNAAPHDTPYGEALLSIQGAGTYLGDKGFIFKPEVNEELQAKGIQVITPMRGNMKRKNTKQEKRLLKKFRRVVETVNGQLTEHFHFGKPGGKSERGLLSRLLYKLTAHTFGLVILRQYNLPVMQLDVLVGA